MKLGRDVGDVLAAEEFSHVTKVSGCRAFLLVIGHVIQRKLLVVRQRVYFGVAEKPRVVDGSSVVEGLYDDFVFIGDSGIAYVYETVR